MKLLFTFGFGLLSAALFAQTDSTKANVEKKDTIKIANILIIKSADKNKKSDSSTTVQYKRKKKGNFSTNWFIVDLGFNNYNDKTDYAAANDGSYLVNKPGFPDFKTNDLKVNVGKSINVNIWFFMQKMNLIKQRVNLKYGLGLELNNYRYKSNISFREGGAVPYSISNEITNQPFIFRDSIQFSKNKLAADYITVPFMVNFVSNPKNHDKGISVSLGVSAGYLYSQRNKQKSDERGKQSGKGDYDLEQFKFAYIAELGLGPVKLYGSYSPTSMFRRSLDIRPYSLGIRLGNW